MNPFLNVAVKAARRAGKTIFRYLDRLERVAVEQKGRNDFVSAVDRMAEADIIDTIHSHYPEHGIVAKEHGGELAHDGEFQWIIEPLDGTANYLHGHPQFAVSIAARHNGQLQHAVVLDLLRDELYAASRGQGAQLNNRRIRVTHQRKLARSLIATGFPSKQRAHLQPWMNSLQALLPRIADLRCGGCAALELAYVACGRVDGYWEPNLNPWDIAAGSLLVREAGGLIADFQGGQNFLGSGTVVAANQMIFNDLLVIVSAASDNPSSAS